MTRTTTDISSRNDIMLAEPPLSPHNDDDTAAALDSKSSADERPLWSHRWTFFTTLLSVQLSQLWRPAVWIGANATTYSNALLAMACTSIALLSIGLPLLILELALGQAYREGAVGVWQVPYFVGQFHSRWTAFGLVSLLVAFVTASYGVVILAWLMHAFVDSFRHTTSASVVWSGEEEQVYISAVEYFFSQIIGQATLMIHNRNDEEDNSNTIQQPTRLVVDNVVYAALIWFLVWAGSSLGVSKLGNLSTFLVIVATILLSTLLGASVSVLTVSSDSPSSSLSRGESVIPPDSAGMMLEAVVQTIYGVGLATGILSTYASYSPNKKDHVAQLASVYTILNAFFVLITGYAISVALDGSGMFNNGNDKDTMANGLHPGPLRAILTSVFIQWPLALNRLGDGSMGWVRLVFVTFFCLGIQFMWAVQTAILTVLRDANTVSTPRWKIAGALSFLGFLFSLIFATDAGFMFMESLDYYATLVLLSVAFMESFAAGWLGQLKEQVEMYGILPVLCYIFSHFGSVIVASSIWFGFEREDVDTNSRLWVGFFGGCVIFLLGLSCTLLSLQKRYSHHYLTNLDRSEPAMSPRLYYIDFCYGSVWALKESLEPVVGPIPTFWCHMMKKIVPQVLLLVWMRHILLAINADSSIGFGKYYGLDVSSPVQILGIVFFAATIALCLLGVIFPQLFAKFVPPPTSQFINRRDTMEDIEDTAVGGSSSESMEELPHMEEPVVLEGGGDDDDAIE